MKKYVFGSVALCAFAWCGVSAAPMLETVENNHFRMTVDPLGARITSLVSKDAGVDFTVPGSPGLFTESSWDRWHSRGRLAKTVFDMEVGQKDGAFSVSATGQGSGVIPFMRVSKRYVSVPDSTALTVEYSFINAPDAMSLQAYSPDIHLSLAMEGRIVSFCYADAEGMHLRGQNEGSSLRTETPMRGWYAAVDRKGEVGAVVTVPYEWLHGFSAWLPGTPSSEIKLLPVGIENGDSFKVKLELIPFKGLAFVSGAGGGLVGSLGDGGCQVVNSRAMTESRPCSTSIAPVRCARLRRKRRRCGSRRMGMRFAASTRSRERGSGRLSRNASGTRLSSARRILRASRTFRRSG